MATNQIQRFGQTKYVWQRTTQGTFLWNSCQNINSEISSPFKLMETSSCHSDESTRETSTRNATFVEANVMNVSTKFQLHPHYGFWDDFLICFRKFSCSVAMATNQIQRFGQNSFGRGLLKEHFCQNICSEIAVSANFYFPIISQWQLIRLEQKHNYSFPRPIDAICEIWVELASWLQRRCRLKMLTDDVRTDDRCLPIL